MPVVYYALDGVGGCKIGFTRNLHQRMKQVGPAMVAAAEVGSYKLEHARHAQFARSRIYLSEWFHVSRELGQHILALQGA